MTQAAAARRGPHVQSGVGRGEAAGVDLAAGRHERQEVQQLLVGVSHRVGLDQGAVDLLHPHVLGAGDDDVLDGVVVDEGLQPTQAEQCVVDRDSHRVLLVHRPRCLAVVQSVGGGGLQQFLDDRAAKLALGLGVHAPLLPQCRRELVRGLRTQHRDLVPVDAPGCDDGRAGRDRRDGRRGRDGSSPDRRGAADRPGE